MRKQIDELALLAQEAMELNPFEEAVFVFGNRQRDKVKLLFWKRNGFVVRQRKEREPINPKTGLHVTGWPNNRCQVKAILIIDIHQSLPATKHHDNNRLIAWPSP